MINWKEYRSSSSFVTHLKLDMCGETEEKPQTTKTLSLDNLWPGRDPKGHLLITSQKTSEP
jgi:hypothetical protein